MKNNFEKSQEGKKLHEEWDEHIALSKSFQPVGEGVWGLGLRQLFHLERDVDVPPWTGG